MPPRKALGWIVIAAGLATIAGGWVGVQSTPVVAVQLAYLASGGIGGIALVMIGTSMHSYDDTRAMREALEELRDRFDDIEDDVVAIREALDEPTPDPRVKGVA
ncbi:MAG: hypothetical protein KY469_14590 [Actinobacteria bacterium]|nr:hypothetical protein [Actinomycetota bacterium]